MYTSDIHRILMNEFDGLWYLPKTSGSTDLDQGRTHNPVNEITAITATTGTNWADPVHDRAGNMTTVPKPASLADGLTASYDAWNRLVEVKDDQTVIGRYEYDGLNRRIKSHIDSGAPSNRTGIDTYVHYYHNSAWQILETRETDSESAQPETLQPKHQYVWSQRYIDAAVLRDENTGANGLCDDQRLYYLNDANFNVTALLDTSGDAVERYLYSPYGVVTIYDPTWTDTRSASTYANVTLYTGRKLDAETGLYYYRNRYYSAQLGRFVSRDPVGYAASDASLCRYVGNMPTVDMDAKGLGAGAGGEGHDALPGYWSPPPLGQYRLPTIDWIFAPGATIFGVVVFPFGAGAGGIYARGDFGGKHHGTCCSGTNRFYVQLVPSDVEFQVQSGNPMDILSIGSSSEHSIRRYVHGIHQ